MKSLSFVRRLLPKIPVSFLMKRRHDSSGTEDTSSAEKSSLPESSLASSSTRSSADSLPSDHHDASSSSAAGGPVTAPQAIEPPVLTNTLGNETQTQVRRRRSRRKAAPAREKRSHVAFPTIPEVLDGTKDAIKEDSRLAEAFLARISEADEDADAELEDRILSSLGASSLDASEYQSSVVEAITVDDTHTRIEEVPRDETSRPPQNNPPSAGDPIAQEFPYSALTYEVPSEPGAEASSSKFRLTTVLPAVFGRRDSPARKALRLLYSMHSEHISSDDLSRTLLKLMTNMRELYAQDFVGMALSQPKTSAVYTIRQCIACGPIGWVFEAVRSDGAKVALKIFSKAQVYNRRTYLDPDVCRSIVDTEVDILRYNSEHGVPGLAQSLASWSDICFIYVVMPLYPATSLDLLLQHPCRGDLHKLCAAQMVAAAHALHQTGYIHRDLKLENILVTTSGHLLLSDFGIARRINSAFDRTATLGSDGYYPPEVIAQGLFGDSYNIFSGKLDVWSLGVVLLELFLRSSSPYRNILSSPEEPLPIAGFIETLVSDPLELREMKAVQQLDGALHDLLLKMLCRNPTQRATMEEVKSHAYFADVKWDNLDEWARKKGIVMPTFRPRQPRVAKRKAHSMMWTDAATLRLVETDAIELMEHDRYWTLNGNKSQGCSKD